MSPWIDGAVVSDEPSDHDTADGVGAGERGTSLGRRALDALYRAQAGRLMRMFSRRSDPQDAADLMQETFTRFARATLERDVSPDCPESYLTQVAVNVLHDCHRNPAHRASIHGVPVEGADLIGPDVVAAIEARDMLNRVEAVMMLLRPMTREIFIARRFQGCSRAEIAAQTGLSIKAVDKHLGHAVAHLHRHLGDRDVAR